MDYLDRAVLELESRWYRHAGTKEAAARKLGLCGTAYFQRVNPLLDDAEAAAAFPDLVDRLIAIEDWPRLCAGVMIRERRRPSSGSRST